MKKISSPTIHQFTGYILTDAFGNSFRIIEKIAESIIDDLDLHIVKKVSHGFTPQGVTIVYVLSESHLVLHTWPESGVIHVDLLTCSLKTKKEFTYALRQSVKKLQPKSIQITSVEF